MGKKRVLELRDDKAFKDYAALMKERNFNAFEVLRYSDYEIRHSNVLAWLLTPGETHGVGDTFLRRIGECLRNKQHSGKLEQLDLAAGLTAEVVQVERERDYVDLMVFFEKEPKVQLVVENKPCRRTSDHVKQLRGYVKEQCKKHGKKHGGSYAVQGVLLTASQSGDPKHKDYLHLSWHEVRRFVDSLLEEGSVSSVEVKAFLRQYVDIVDRNILGLGPSSDSFRCLLKNHGQTLERMLREWKPGVVPACWGVSPDDESAVDSLLRDFRQRPGDLRDAVKEHLKGEKFKTLSSGAPGGTAFWVSFWEKGWFKRMNVLGIGDQCWSFEFTHRSVTVQLGGGSVSGKKRTAVKSVMAFMRSVEGKECSRLVLDFEGALPYFYRRNLLTEADFSYSTQEEMEKRALEKVKTFLGCTDYKRINRYFEVLAFSPSPR